MNDIIQDQLNLMAEFQSALEAERLAKQEKIDQLLSDEIKASMIEIEAEFDERVAAATEKLEALKGLIRENVVAHGETVKGTHLMAVYSLRTSWNNKLMKALLEKYPEVGKAKVETSVVQIRSREI